MELLPAAAVVALLKAPEPVTNPTPHNRARIAIETKGSNVQSSTQRREARLDTSTRCSFHLVTFAGGLYSEMLMLN